MKGRGRGSTDPNEQAAKRWGAARRRTLGISFDGKVRTDSAPFEPGELLGKFRSSLGAVKSERVAAGSGTGAAQHFPEVYRGDALLVHRAWHEMEGTERLIFDAHFTWAILPVKMKLVAMGLSERQYFGRLREARRFLAGRLAAFDQRELTALS